MIQRIFFICISLLLIPLSTFAIDASDIVSVPNPKGSIIDPNFTIIDLLTLIQSILLKVVLPFVIVGVGLFTAFKLFTADGDEARMKQTWKSVTFGSIALIIIALSYAVISIITRISL